MRSSATPTDKIFAHTHYQFRYRSVRRARWSMAAQPAYVALFLLGGKLRWHTMQRSEVGDETEYEIDGRKNIQRKTAHQDEVGDIQEAGVLFVNPGDIVNVEVEQAQFLMLTLAPSFILDCAVRLGLTRRESLIIFHTRATTGSDARLLRMAGDLRDEVLEETAGQALVIAALIEQLTIHLLRRYANVRRSSELEMSRAGLVDRRIRRAVELMHIHLNRDLPLAEIAAAAYLSPFHFARLFKKLTGASPHAYLATLRMARAQSLLVETDLSITEVGGRVGYSSSSHFAKAFRQATGLSPRAFRAALVRHHS